MPTVTDREESRVSALTPRCRCGGDLPAVGTGLWAMNRARARAAVLDYDELEPEVLATLEIGSFVEVHVFDSGCARRSPR